MTVLQLEQMVIAQDNRCAICKNVFKNRKDTQIDHNHTTGKVRALLCIKCNMALGLLEENIIILDSMNLYLKKWSINPIESDSPNPLQADS
jgi:hypothetical protein